MTLPEYNFLYIKAGTGTSGTTGDRLEADWKYNFDLIKSLLASLDEDISQRILSHEIQQIKVEDNIAYFTTDNGTTWTSLGPAFANLAGNPDDCPALVAKFSDYATLTQMTEAQNRLSSLEVSIVTVNSTLELLNTDVENLKQQMDAPTTGVLARLAVLEVSNSHKITSQSIIEIREVASGLLEYTVDGTNWHPVAEATGIDWGTIGGDIENQADLMNRFDQLSDLINSTTSQLTTDVNTLKSEVAGMKSKVAEIDNLSQDVNNLNDSLTEAKDNIDANTSQINSTNASLQSHIDDTSNPHQVTKAQVGLGNVDNTSDMSKPVSTPQKTYIDQQVATASAQVQVLTASAYEAITAKNANTNYRITDKY